jgi:H+/Cl- antiporter ClcA
VWRTFAPRVSRSDLTGDMVGFAGEEDRLPWRLAPIRMLAMIATVGFGAGMGTEAPAAYLGVATGVALGDRWWHPLLRPAAVGGGAAGVAALMGIPLLGTAYILELGRRHHAPLNAERVTAALVGGFVGWLLHIALRVDLLRLVATISSAAAGGCGGLFVPFLAIGDLAGRVFAPSLRLPSDLAGAAGAAGGISGGYHLPFAAMAMVLGQGGSHLAMLTCFATVVVAGFVGKFAASLVGHSYIEKRPHQLET